MTIMLPRTARFKKAKKQVVKLFFAYVVGCATVSCGSIKKNIKHRPERNCIKYTLNYATDDRDAELTLDTLFVRGITRLCATNAVVPFVEIIVSDERGSDMIKVISDQKGRFLFKLKPGFYSMTASSVSGRLAIPTTYMGHDGNVLKLDLYLATHEGLINEMDDPKLIRELKRLKKQRQ